MQLFTPPGSSAPAPSAPADDASSPTADATVANAPDVEEAPDADSLLAHRNTTVDGGELYVEQFEHKEIELTSSATTTEPDEHSIEVIAYDDSNSTLKAAANEGERPQVDGLSIEATEVSFQEAQNAAPLEIESFWASEPFGAANAARGDATADTEAPPEEREVEHAEMALDDAESSEDNDSQSLEELKESEPWSVSPAVVAAPPSHPVASALERLAARVRNGEIDVPANPESSDEAALAAVLTALLRQRR